MEDASVEIAPEVAAALDEESAAYIGRWKTLVSSTNWEKGRIIFEWRDALIDADAPASEHSDEAWARRVGGVTGQHVGRLRRVYHRFGSNHEKYAGVFWSHFQAALDWDDAEMWLEGAAQSRWSVSQMRQQRFETVGGEKPSDAPDVSAEMDEDFEPLVAEETPANLKNEFDESRAGPRHDGPDFGDEEDGSEGGDGTRASTDGDFLEEATTPVSLVRPFEDLPELPDDLADAFEQFKLAILTHKRNDWSEISLDDVLRTLDGLKALAAAPTDDETVA